MHTVFTTYEVIRKFANQTADHIKNDNMNIRNRYGNVFVGGDTIYSYGHHFPMARIWVDGENTLALVNAARYSATTAKHQHAVRCALGDYVEVPSCDKPDHGANLEYIERRMREAEATAKRCRRPFNLNSCEREWDQLAKQRARYNAFFVLVGDIMPRPNFEAMHIRLEARMAGVTPATIERLAAKLVRSVA